MDLTTLLARLRGRRTNHVITFEAGRSVPRDHDAVARDVDRVRERLAGYGVGRGSRVGIRAPNCYAWLVHDLALLDLRAVSVAFTDDFKQHRAAELCDRYSLSLMLVTATEHAQVGLPHVAPLVVDEASDAPEIAARPGPVEDDEPFHRPWRIFSSGSAGGVKGLIIDRRGIEQSIEAFTQAVGPRRDDRVLLFLPLSNFQQRLIYYVALWHGFDVVIVEPLRAMVALRDTAPTVLIAPPAFYEAIENRLLALPRWKLSLAELGGHALARLPLRYARQRAARRLFGAVYDALGGNMRFMVTGMAPTKRTTLERFARMQLPLFETYGLTECGSVSLNVPGACRLGSVGRLLPGVEVRLADDGEIIVHREHLTAVGYFEAAPGESDKVFIGQGQVATGDIGCFDDDGFLYLIGRKKEIIVTAGGEKIHPEPVEAELDACPDVRKSVVFGGPDGNSLVAVVSLRQPHDPEARLRVERFAERVGSRGGSRRVDRLIFTDLELSRDNGFLRPNLKLDRQRIGDHFRERIEEIPS